ncbi:hypothetical protein STENM223S_10898 [Streptomyces tendae]
MPVGRGGAGARQRGLQAGDPVVALGQLGAEAAEGVVDVRHAVAADHEREAQPLHVAAAHRAVRGQGVPHPLGCGVGQRPAVAAAHHGERHRGHDDGQRDDEEQEHDHRWGPHGRVGLRSGPEPVVPESV